jgi:hypothetical protein
MTVYTDRGAIPTPELDEPPHGPDQMAALADRVAGLFNAPRVTETERDAIEGDDLYDGRLVMIVDSGGAFVRVDVFHADDPADPAAGGTWQLVSDPTAYVPKAGGTFTGNVTVEGGVFPTLGDDAFTVTANPEDYPQGYSVFRDAQGSFPQDANGIVETLNPTGGSNYIQYNWNSIGRDVFFRVATSGTTWQRWQRLHSSTVSIYQNSAQTIANTTYTTIEFDTVDYENDDLADLANNRIVLDKGGIWLVVASLAYEEDGQDGDYRFNIIRFEGYNMTEVVIPPTAAWTTVVSISLINASSGSVLSLRGRHDAGGDRNTKPGPDRVFLQATYIGQVF